MFCSSLPLTGKVERISQEWGDQMPTTDCCGWSCQLLVWIQERELPCWLWSSRVAQKWSNNLCELLVPYHATQGTCCLGLSEACSFRRNNLVYLGNSSDFPQGLSYARPCCFTHCLCLWNSGRAWAISGLRSLDGNMITHTGTFPLPFLGRHSCGRTEDRKIAFNFLDASKLSKMAVRE